MTSLGGSELEVDEWELLLDLETEAEKLAIEVETSPRSIRGLNYLRRLGITTVRDLLARPKSEVREMFSDQPGVVAQFEEIWRRASRGAVSIGGDKAPPSRSVPLDSADLPTDTGT